MEHWKEKLGIIMIILLFISGMAIVEHLINLI